MGLCKNCAYWENIQTAREIRGVEFIAGFENIGDCNNQNLTFITNKSNPRNENGLNVIAAANVSIDDNDNIEEQLCDLGVIQTGSDFGCVWFEQRLVNA